MKSTAGNRTAGKDLLDPPPAHEPRSGASPGEPPVAARGARRGDKANATGHRRTRIRRGVTSVVGVFAAWEIAVRVFEPSTVIIVAPSAVAEAFARMIADGSLLEHFTVSMRQFVLGYLLAASVGISLGLIMGASRRAHDYGDPWMTGLYATPSVALAPLFIIWLGFGDLSHIAIIALAAFFPIIINTIDGVHEVDRDLRDVGIAFRASRHEVFRHIDLPGAMPYIFTGLRLALARALVGVVVADLFGAKAGLGFLILSASQLFRTADVFVGVLILAALGVGFTSALRALQKWLTPWQVEVRQK